MMDALGNGEQRAVEGDGRRTSFAWSPDGARIAYVSEEGNETEIHVVDVAEKQERRLTKNTATEQLGNWSPDGIWIVAHDGIAHEVHAPIHAPRQQRNEHQQRGRGGELPHMMGR